MLTSASQAAAATAGSASMQVHTAEWMILALTVLILIGIDLYGHVRKAHEPTMGEALRWLSFYVVLAVAFGVYLVFAHNPSFSIEFFATYFTEYSLSVDNIFIFIVIMASFRVPRQYQQKALLYGIVIALVLRFVFIMLGAALLARFSWLFFFFAAFLLYTAVAQIREGFSGDEEANPDEYEPNALTRWASKVFRVTQGFVGDKMLVRRSGKTWATPMLLCIISIGSADLMFALDSIPASFGLSREPFIIFAANAFALMGLRQMFFLVDGLLERLVFLHYGLAAVLGFIGVKLLLEAFHGVGMFEQIPAIEPLTSLGVIVTLLVITVASSLIYTRLHPKDEQ